MQLARVDGIQGRVFEAVDDFQKLSKEVIQNLQYSTNTGPEVSTSSRSRGQWRMTIQTIKSQTQITWILDKYELKGAKGQSCKLKGAEVQPACGRVQKVKDANWRMQNLRMSALTCNIIGKVQRWKYHVAMSMDISKYLWQLHDVSTSFQIPWSRSQVQNHVYMWRINTVYVLCKNFRHCRHLYYHAT